MLLVEIVNFLCCFDNFSLGATQTENCKVRQTQKVHTFFILIIEVSVVVTKCLKVITCMRVTVRSEKHESLNNMALSLEALSSSPFKLACLYQPNVVYPRLTSQPSALQRAFVDNPHLFSLHVQQLRKRVSGKAQAAY